MCVCVCVVCVCVCVCVCLCVQAAHLRLTQLSDKLVSRAIRICVRMSGARARKGGSGKNTYGQVFVR